MAWSILSNASVSASSVQATTESDPSVAGDGIALTGVDAVLPVLTAPNGQTFTGTGTLNYYFWSYLLARWVPAPRAYDSFVDHTGLSEAVLPALPVTFQAGRLAAACKGVGLSGGTQITVTLLCATNKGGAL